MRFIKNNDYIYINLVKNNHVIMDGPVKKIFDGEIILNDIIKKQKEGIINNGEVTYGI